MPKLKSKIRVGITMGDPSGIGPCVISKALPELKGLAEFLVIGDKSVFKKSQRQPDFDLLDLHNVDPKSFKFGQIKAEYGRASMEYLEKALELISAKEIDCLVTAPISKEAINLGGFHYSGHTEYFARKTRAKDVVMMLLNGKLRFSLITRHIPLKEVASRLEEKKISRVISITHKALKELFSIKEPRIAVCGLNPHASDNGLIGCEENKIIKPALRRSHASIKNISGPMSSDVAIAKAAGGSFDCLIAMYHDQALIPLKLLGDKEGVNLTLGLPFIRTSPLHGTAFDIASSGSADPGSFIAAVKLAVKCASNLKKA
ncbi:MAG: 4-hydroxythreonine-4-phosphate dehydrogenase PdxA [Candidatus Omnitrophica bacterium]|nr:4-hydroxythreonine-4-phosphate dehydrogenase PdxA [Candidatus Omnitrophota bacterium]